MDNENERCNTMRVINVSSKKQNYNHNHNPILFTNSF